MFSYCSNSPVSNTDAEGNRPVKVNVSIDSKRPVKNKLITKSLDKKTPKQRTGFKKSRNGGKKADSSYRNDGLCGKGGYTITTLTFDKDAARSYIDNLHFDSNIQVIASAVAEFLGGNAVGVLAGSAWASIGFSFAATAGVTVRSVCDNNMWETASKQLDSIQADNVQITIVVWDTGDFTYNVSEAG